MYIYIYTLMRVITRDLHTGSESRFKGGRGFSSEKRNAKIRSCIGMNRSPRLEPWPLPLPPVSPGVSLVSVTIVLSASG